MPIKCRRLVQAWRSSRGLLQPVQPYKLIITRTVIQENLVAQNVYDISEKEKINQTKEAVRDYFLSNCQTDL